MLNKKINRKCKIITREQTKENERTDERERERSERKLLSVDRKFSNNDGLVANGMKCEIKCEYVRQNLVHSEEEVVNLFSFSR